MASTFILCMTPAARGGNDSNLSEMSLEDLMNVKVVTSSRSEETILKSSGTVYVVTEKEIAQHGWLDLSDILKNTIANMDWSNSYSHLYGGQRGWMSGAAFDGTILLIDDREVNYTISDEFFDLYNIPAFQIKRVEILQGPNSALYGSHAVQGVVHVVTKVADEDNASDQGLVQTSVGDVNTRQLGGLFRRRFGDLNVGFSASHYQSDANWKRLREFTLDNSSFARDATNAPWRDTNADHVQNYMEGNSLHAYLKYKELYLGDYFRNYSYSGNLESITLDYRKKRVESNVNVAFLGFKHNFNESNSIHLELQHQSEYFLGYDPIPMNMDTWASSADVTIGVETHTQTSSKDSIQARVNSKLFQNNLLIGGYDFWYRTASSFIDPNTGLDPSNFPSWWTVTGPGEQNIKHSLFAEDNWDILPDKFRMVAGIRYNHQDTVNDSWTPRSSFIFQPSPSNALKLTYASGFKSPNVIALSSVEPGKTVQPMRMHMLELNYTQQFNGANVKGMNILALYRMISTYNYTTYTQGNNYFVEAKPTDYVTGVEDQLKLATGDFDASIGGRVAIPRPQSYAGKDNLHPDIPMYKLLTNMNYKFFEHLSGNLVAQWWSPITRMTKTLDGADNEVFTIPRTFFINLGVDSGEFMIEKAKVKLGAYVDNVLNDFYYTALPGTSPLEWLQPPRTFRIMLTASY